MTALAVRHGRERGGRKHARLAILRAAAIVVALPMSGSGQPGAVPVPLHSGAGAASALPFAIGERLGYRIRINAAGNIGRGVMWIEGPVDVRGTRTMHLRSRFDARVGWMRAFSESESWLDPAVMAALRYRKDERQPLSKSAERVDIFPDERRWTSSNGGAGESATSDPLDELSFIYYIRTLPLDSGAVFTSYRHYDEARNPVTIRVLRRQRIHAGKAVYETVVVEMRVRDGKRFRNDDGVITLYLTDDERRIPVRIESPAPLVGTAIFTLDSIGHQ